MIVFSLIKSIIEEVGGQDEDGRVMTPLSIINCDEVSSVRSGDWTAVM